MPFEISPRHVQQACTRAVRYRRKLAIAAGHPEGNIEEAVSYIPARYPEPSRKRPGWWEVGMLFDCTTGHNLPILFHPETERVGIERPPAPPPDTPKPPAMDIPPLGQLSWGGYFHASPAYRYFFEGQEYSASEAEALCQERNSAEGWTWEHRKDCTDTMI